MMTKDERAQAVEQLGVLADRVARERRMCSDCESWDHCERDGCALLHKVALSIAAKPAISGTHGEWRVYEADTPQCTQCGCVENAHTGMESGKMMAYAFRAGSRHGCLEHPTGKRERRIDNGRLH